MKKIFKICISLFLILLFLFTYVNASNINMDLENNTTTNVTNTLEENLFENDLPENETSIADVNNTINTADTDNSSEALTTTVNSQEDEFLTVENILSIIIIVIGILLVFLAIAILVRFK